MRVPSVKEIDHKLRSDFRERVRSFGQDADRPDPILLPLFRTLAEELGELYRSVEGTRQALLDEIMERLGIEPRIARPAQTIVRLQSAQPLSLPAGLELVGQADSGGRLTFTTDAAVTVSAARLSFAFSYEGGVLQLLSAVEMPDEIQEARPSLDPVAARLGGNPMVFMAIDSLPRAHLSGHGLFFDLSPGCEELRKALRTAVWGMGRAGGAFDGMSLMRPRRANAGVRMLDWLMPGGDPVAHVESEAGLPSVPDGFYAGRVFVLPQVPQDRAFTAGAPAGMDGPLRQIFGAAASTILSMPRAWLMILLPPEASGLQSTINGISLHAVSASNVERFNQTVVFAQHGKSIPVSKEAGGKGYLVAAASISDERNQEYAPVYDAGAEAGRGRYSIQNGCLTLEPPQDNGGQEDRQAAVSLWLTSGAAGNRVGVNRTAGLANPYFAPGVQIVNPTSAAGGTNGESFAQAEKRFAMALVARDRIVTRADMLAAARAFDWRIRQVETEPSVERGPEGLERVQHVRIALSRSDFRDGEQVRVLTEDLQEYVRDRMPAGTRLKLEVAWL